MVIRIGKLTGNRYDESVDAGSISECCHQCHSEEEVEKCMAPVMRAKDSIDCSSCRGCPEYWREE